jgi:hypothetical protein
MRSWAAVMLAAVLLPAGCGCKGDCEDVVQFSFPDVMKSAPLGSVATACVEKTCSPAAPDQEAVTVYVNDGDVGSEVQTSLTVRNKTGDVVFERTTPLKLKGHKPGRFCSTACRTGAIEFRR